jgi:hypothetical protein
VVLQWTIEQARLYQLWSVGLHGRSYEEGKAGIRASFQDLGGIQLDPLPILGRNHDLVIQSRVDGTRPGDTLDLIHEERLGFEYWDKGLCLLPIGTFPWFRALMAAGGETWERRREARLNRDHPGAVEAVYHAVSEHGPLSSRELKDLDVAQGEHRSWKSTKAANGALEVLWNKGELSVSHRQNYRRYFDLTERVIPSEFYEDDPPPIDAFWRYLLQKRVHAVGLLPAKGDAEVWAFLRGARSEKLPEQLVSEGKLTVVEVNGIKTPFYAPAHAQEDLACAEKEPLNTTARFIAPLDPLLWGRRALSRLWRFDYAWEVYKPIEKRVFGYYVLPILCGDRFVSRFDGRYDRTEKTLHVLAYYEEPNGIALSHPVIHAGFQRFLSYLDGERIILPTGEVWDGDRLSD